MKCKFICIAFLLTTCYNCNNVVRVSNDKEQNPSAVTAFDIEASENYKGISSCAEGKALAKSELEEGHLRYIFSSYGSRQDLPKQLKQLYNVEIINVKGVLGIPNKCYNDIMYKEIQKRYGNDAFNKAIEAQ